MKLSTAERARLVALRGHPIPQPADDDDTLRRLLADEIPDTLIGRAWLAGGDAPDWSRLRARLAAIPRPVFPLEGRDALALGVAPGPAMGALLRDTRNWWLAGGCRADASDCRAEFAAQLARRARG